jgi:hypothetical protein
MHRLRTGAKEMFDGQVSPGELGSHSRKSAGVVSALRQLR